MTENPLLKKLRLLPNQRLLLLNADETWITFFAGPYDVDTKAVGTYDFVLLFAPNQAALQEYAPVATKAIRPDGTLWAAFPKGSSGKQTDLTRDKGWESLPAQQWQHLNLISLDEVWSAVGLRPAKGKPTNLTKKKRENAMQKPPKTENPYIDTVNRIVRLPEDLGQVLAENKEALVFFETLSFTCRREYVDWVTSAKREETRQRRVLQMVEMLDKGLKNPMDKGKS